MKITVDEYKLFNEKGKLLPLDTPVHLFHNRTLQPMCVDEQLTEAYMGTSSEDEVTCHRCIIFMVD